LQIDKSIKSLLQDALSIYLIDEKKLNDFMDGIEDLRRKGTWKKEDIIELYFGILPEFAHKETGKYLDQRM